jgi:ribosomal protein L11 methyltransferase
MQPPIKRKNNIDPALMDTGGIRNAILEKVTASSARLTPQHLEKTIMERHGLNKPRARAVLKDLVTRGQLEYIYEFGSTYLVPSFKRPVRISAHVIVKPPGHRYRPAPDDVVIQIKPGAAFGGGRHPTTRLAIKAIEYALKIAGPGRLNRHCSVLDIGTGSGILAIAAVCLGIQKGLGIDIDPCAISEARENIALNNLENQIVISNRRLDSIDPVFMMVVANLRYPSLKKFYPQISDLTARGGWVVLSGYRPHEQADLMDLYTARNFKSIWTADENDWAAAALEKFK